MPTGYTDAIAKGITFKEYALRCARAFGACIMMRDDPMDAKIPDEFKPSEYHAKELKKAERKAQEIRKLSPAECLKHAKRERTQEIHRYERYLKEKVELRAKYDAMLVQVEAWVPPNSEFKQFKEFMRDQIKSSIEFDCDLKYWNRELDKAKRPVPSAEEWRQEKLAQCAHDIEYQTKEDKEERERAASRSQWVQQLKKSLEKS